MIYITKKNSGAGSDIYIYDNYKIETHVGLDYHELILININDDSDRVSHRGKLLPFLQIFICKIYGVLYFLLRAKTNYSYGILYKYSL